MDIVIQSGVVSLLNHLQYPSILRLCDMINRDARVERVHAVTGSGSVERGP
jgi:hypothetical protein